MNTLNILIISNTAWDISNSFGNTFSNLFGAMEGVRIANIYCKYGKPNNETVCCSFQITEKMLLKNRANRSFKTGSDVSAERGLSGEPCGTDLSSSEKKVLLKASILRWRFLFWIREIIWFLGRWQSEELYRFVEEFKPDLIFQPIYDSFYLMRMNRVLQDKYLLPMAGFIGDDFYTLKYFSLSPLFWIDRLIKRKRVRDTIRRCEALYVANEAMKREYDKIFRINSSVLMKGNDFVGSAPVKSSVGHPVKLVYTGNLGAGRWESLRSIGHVLNKLNADGTAALLHIYSHSPMSVRIRKALTLDSIVLHGGVHGNEIVGIQQDADVLVYAEALRQFNNSVVRLSFSTKIIDYCHAARCILAYGNRNLASLLYLEKNDAAIIASSPLELKERLGLLLASDDFVLDYAGRAWECGVKHHQRSDNTRKLYSKLKCIAESRDQPTEE